MLHNLIVRYKAFLLIAILVTGFLLRYHNHTTWPREGATFDEYAWTWLGVNLITRGVPVSWSPHPQYSNRIHYISPKGARFWLVSPYLEHPPLFGLVAGFYALIRGASDMYDVSFSVMRELALILGIVSIGLVYVLAASVYGPVVGLGASLFYAIMPSAAIGSRILQNENFFVPLFLAILFMLKKYIDTDRKKWFLAAAVLSGLATLAKVPWIAASIAGAGVLLYKKKFREAGMYAAIAGVIFSLFILYGLWWDRALFVSLWRLQLNRYDLVFDSIFSLIQQPYLVDRYYTDGWIYAGWAALIVMLTTDLRRHYVIVFGFLGYFAVYILGIPNEPGHGWYRYPLYPFLMIALGWYMATYWRKLSILTPLMLLGVVLSMLSHAWDQVLGFSYVVYRGIIVWFGMSSLPVFIGQKRTVKFVHWNTVLQLVTIILLSIGSILLYTEQ